MKYKNGKRISPMLHECEDLFERNLFGFKKKMDEFYSRKPPAGETTEERKLRLEKKDRDFAHLKQEMQLLKGLGIAFSKLAVYRAESQSARGETRRQADVRADRLCEEKHHPTEDLENNMRAVGRPKPSPDHTAHHVIPGKGKLEITTETRLLMHLCGIPINDSDNGAWMMNVKELKAFNWFGPDSYAHLEIHTHNYENWLANRIQIAAKNGSEGRMRQTLREIWGILEQGNHPKEWAQPPIPGYPTR